MLSARHLVRGALLAACASLAILTIAPASSQAFEPHLSPVGVSQSQTVTDTAAKAPALAATPKRMTPVERPSSRTAVGTGGRAEAGTRSASGRSPVSGASTGSGGNLQALLAEQIRQHPILRGTTISYGDAQGYQAISYYRSGRIVVSRSHTASLSRIVAHEVWHVIDWRDNGRIDWGERVPPR